MVAQLVEHLSIVQSVPDSNPVKAAGFSLKMTIMVSVVLSWRFKYSHM